MTFGLDRAVIASRPSKAKIYNRAVRRSNFRKAASFSAGSWVKKRTKRFTAAAVAPSLRSTSVLAVFKYAHASKNFLPFAVWNCSSNG